MIKGAIVGTGKIAVTGHMPAYLTGALQQKVKIEACADTHRISRESFTKQFPGIPVYKSLDEVIKNHKINFVDICVPPAYHADYIEKAISYGLNILCEKPFASNPDEAEYLMKLLLESGKVFMPCHQYRYSPVWSSFKNVIDENAGRWFMQFNVCRVQADNGFNPGNPSWRTDKSVSGGGILADTGIHYIYLSTWLLGKPHSVTAKAYNNKQNPYPVEDTIIAVIECEKGISQINLTWAADKRANSALLVNESASVYYNGKTIEKNSKGCREILTAPDASDKSTYINQYVRLIEEYASCIENNLSSSDWIHEAYNSVKILNTSYESSVINKTIILD